MCLLIWQLLHKGKREDGRDIFTSPEGQAFVC